MERKSPYHCSVCGVLKTSENSNKCNASISGFHSYCKKCLKEWKANKLQQALLENPNFYKDRYEKTKEYALAWNAEQRKKYPERYKEYAKKHYSLHKEKRYEDVKRWRNTDHGKEMQAKHQATYRKNSHDKDMERAKRYRHNNTNARLACSLRARIKIVLKGKSKSESSMILLGCNSHELKVYLESKFIDGMSWDNYGKYGWHIDHIRPCASFDLTDPEQQKQCFHYSNLQPLWWRDNIIKSDTWDGN
jgi:hypothetical protein